MSYPFAHASSFAQHINDQVTVIGKVTEVNGNIATVDSSGTVNVRVNATMDPVESGCYYRFLGKVVDDTTLSAHDQHKITNVGDYDADIARRVIDAQAGQSPYY
ncbi:hypothetical protein B9G98_01363 [Wickerhamiella sorbophila]|uniref:Replication factor A protein 3 n=1 Tax=Wickerhamiella sorbophila TaxID=45607 RepID=A0A2T0FFH0_9ASCO|nr:hypothetical protein B9G98_01363 [Wickerhamiella sorbophila]PRT53743.1 hypothetical protein B9G98_01363 [Wickerhamiella sorbophila]